MRHLFFGNPNLDNWWKNKIASLYPKQKFGLKIGMCAICGREDYVFPSGELHVCDKCYRRMKDNHAEITHHHVEIHLEGDICNICGRKIYKTHIVHTYICNKCTRLIGRKAREYREDYRRIIGARKIA